MEERDRTYNSSCPILTYNERHVFKVKWLIYREVRRKKKRILKSELLKHREFKSCAIFFCNIFFFSTMNYVSLGRSIKYLMHALLYISHGFIPYNKGLRHLIKS